MPTVCDCVLLTPLLKYQMYDWEMNYWIDHVMFWHGLRKLFWTGASPSPYGARMRRDSYGVLPDCDHKLRPNSPRAGAVQKSFENMQWRYLNTSLETGSYTYLAKSTIKVSTKGLADKTLYTRDFVQTWSTHTPNSNRAPVCRCSLFTFPNRITYVIHIYVYIYIYIY